MATQKLPTVPLIWSDALMSAPIAFAAILSMPRTSVLEATCWLLMRCSASPARRFPHTCFSYVSFVFLLRPRGKPMRRISGQRVQALAVL